MNTEPVNPAVALAARKQQLDSLRQEVNKVMVGQERLLDRMLIALITNGHILLEGVPGLAKTAAVKTLAQPLGLDFRRNHAPSHRVPTATEARLDFIE